MKEKLVIKSTFNTSVTAHSLGYKNTNIILKIEKWQPSSNKVLHYLIYIKQ